MPPRASIDILYVMKPYHGHNILKDFSFFCKVFFLQLVYKMVAGRSSKKVLRRFEDNVLTLLPEISEVQKLWGWTIKRIDVPWFTIANNNHNLTVKRQCVKYTWFKRPKKVLNWPINSDWLLGYIPKMVTFQSFVTMDTMDKHSGWGLENTWIEIETSQREEDAILRRILRWEVASNAPHDNHKEAVSHTHTH